MTHRAGRFGAPECLILVGAGIFVFILALSALFQADIRWLHFFQAWMYVAAAGLALRRNRLGYFIGVSAAGLWDYGNLFATTFFSNGLRYLAAWVQTGKLRGMDQIIAVPAWIGNFLVVAGCIWAYSRLPHKRVRDAGVFLLTAILTTAFFAADMALCQPRYLALFPKLLHPHLP